jgi:hypothetical protein
MSAMAGVMESNLMDAMGCDVQTGCAHILNCPAALPAGSGTDIPELLYWKT